MAEALDVQIRADVASFTKGMNEAIAGINPLLSESKKVNIAMVQMSKSMATLRTV